MMLAPLLTGFVTLCCFGDTPDRPPPLTFEKHVDYIAWCNDLLSRGKTENAFPLYEGLYTDAQGRDGIRSPEGAAKEQFDQIGIGLWEANDYPAVASYLRECAPHLEVFRKATQLKDFWQPRTPETELLLMVQTPVIGAGVLASAATLTQAWMKQDNQFEKLTDAHRMILQNASHCRQAGLFYGAMVSMQSQRLVYRSILSALRDGILDGKAAKRTYGTLRKHDPKAVDWVAVWNFEWASQLDALQFAYPDGKLNDDRWKKLRAILIAASFGKAVPSSLDTDPRATIAMLDRHFEGMQQIVKGSPSATKLRKLREYYEKRRSIHEPNPLVRLFNPPGLSRTYERTLRVEAHRRGTMLALAIHAHHAKHGKWPKSLKKIDKRLRLKGLKKYRRDPFSGKSFKYKLKDGEPLLYSIGTDGKDDGGRHDPKWGEGDDGGDFVFWPRRPRPPRRP